MITGLEKGLFIQVVLDLNPEGWIGILFITATTNKPTNNMGLTK